MPVVAAMSIREANVLLRSWGFELEKGTNSGGHAVWIRDDRRVQLPAEGRHAPVTQVMLRKAASICGVPLAKFKAGPPPEVKEARPTAPFVPTMPPVADPPANDPPVIDLTEQPTNGNGNGNGNGHNGNGHLKIVSTPVDDEDADEDFVDLGPQETEEQRRKPPSERILNFLQARPNVEIHLADLCERLEMKTPNAASAMNTVMKNHPEVQRARRGRYVYVPSLLKRTPEQEHEERMEQMRMYRRVETDSHGRVFLKDHQGDMWVAIKVERHFFPIAANGENA
jgi:hypothetical protein